MKRVKDELPPFGKWVICFCRIYGYYIGAHMQIDDSGYGNWHDGKQLGVLPPIYWQELPEVPTEEIDLNDLPF